jgi:hypothetical protein
LSGKGIRRAQTISELESAIDDLITTAASRKNALFEADKILQMVLGVEETSASDRLRDVIESLLHNQVDRKVGGLPNAKALHEFLYANDKNTIKYLGRLAKTYDVNHLMYVLVSLSGNYNLGVSSIFHIFKIVNSKDCAENIAPWREVRWWLLQQYLSVNLVSETSFNLAKLRLFIPYIFYPHRFLMASSVFKRLVAKYLIRIFFTDYARINHSMRQLIFKLRATITGLGRIK